GSELRLAAAHAFGQILIFLIFLSHAADSNLPHRQAPYPTAKLGLTRPSAGRVSQPARSLPGVVCRNPSSPALGDPPQLLRLVDCPDVVRWSTSPITPNTRHRLLDGPPRMPRDPRSPQQWACGRVVLAAQLDALYLRVDPPGAPQRPAVEADQVDPFPASQPRRRQLAVN